jgi:hypothetical protein
MESLSGFWTEDFMIARRQKRLKQRLEDRKRSKLRKLSNTKDRDDPRWVKRQVELLDKEIAKKEKTAEHKREQKKVRRNSRSQ